MPLIGPLTKVVPLKLFLDIVPSSSEDVTRAMRGQPKRLSQNYPKRNLYMFWFRFTSEMLSFLQRCFLHSQPPFSTAGLSFVFKSSFGCSLFCRLFVCRLYLPYCLLLTNINCIHTFNILS